MTDPEATKRHAFYLEGRHIDALLNPDSARSDLRQEARSILRAVRDGTPMATIHSEQTDDPRGAGGSIIGPGGPMERDAVLFDSRKAILPEEIETAVASGTSGGEPMPDAVAMLVRGRINRPPDDAVSRMAPAEKVEHLHMLSWEAAADLVVDIQTLAKRDGSWDSFVEMLEAAWGDRVKRGLTRPAP